MDRLLTQLNILADGLEKKEHALREIVNITENQSTVLQSGLSAEESQAFIVQMNREKQIFIQQVIKCDNMFESVLKDAGPALDAAPESYKPQVLDLQKRIRRVMDLDVKIRVYEEKNRGLMEKRPPVALKPPEPAEQTPSAAPQKQLPLQPDANRIISAYAKNTRNYKNNGK